MYGANRENIRSAFGARTMIYNCKGGDSSYGIYAEYSGLIGVRGYVPNADSSSGSGFGGQVIADGPITGDNGIPTTPPTPPRMSTWANSSGNSYRTVYNGWRNDGTVRQGQYSGQGLHTGLWLWGSDVSNAMTGKTIIRARVFITRKSTGGSASRQPVYIRWHTYTNYPSGKPTVSSDCVVAYFKWGESKWVELPQTFCTAFANGTAKGIGIYTPNNSPYMIFDDNAKIEFTYS